MSPTGLVCDRRLLQRYIRESFELEDRVVRQLSVWFMRRVIQSTFAFQNPSKGKQVLHDLVKLVDGVTAALQELREGCPSVLLQQLFEKASLFVLQLQNFRWQMGWLLLRVARHHLLNCLLLVSDVKLPLIVEEQDATEQPERTPQLILETNLRKIFHTYKQLLRGKLYFLFSDLRKDLCGEGSSN